MLANEALNRSKELEECIRKERGFLLRLAYVQLNNMQDAADVVQEMALAALQSIDKFEGRSSMKTWLVSILRFKILDVLRANSKLKTHAMADLESELSVLKDASTFNSAGEWSLEPLAWWTIENDPCHHMEQTQLLGFLEKCLEKLPEPIAQIFLMREYLGFDISEIAERIKMSSGNIRVVLMRSRLAMRGCIEKKFKAT